MYLKRRIRYLSEYSDPNAVKIYTIAYPDKKLNIDVFVERLSTVKQSQHIEWDNTPSFAIFHSGKERDYLIFCWWLNDNELFNSVSVRDEYGWVEDHNKYSFCVYDLEVIWAERNYFIQTIDCETPSIHNYRQLRYQQD